MSAAEGHVIAGMTVSTIQVSTVQFYEIRLFICLLDLKITMVGKGRESC